MFAHMTTGIPIFSSAVEVSVAHDKSEFLFDFDRPFEINDDVEVLKRLGRQYSYNLLMHNYNIIMF